MALGKSYTKDINPGILNAEERFIHIPITDIPVLVSDAGEIVCIPKEDEVFSAAFVGSSGMGKTLGANSMVSNLYHAMGYNVAVMNDLSEETYAWSEPMQSAAFKEYTKWWINQEPCPSPLVYIFPHTNSLELPLNKLYTKNYVKIVLPFGEILDNLEFFLDGVLSDFDLGKSGNYINDIKEDLAQCETPQQVKDVLEEKLPGGEKRGFEAMRAKIFNAFSNLFKEEILDITNPECHTYLSIKNPKFVSNPLSVIMKARGIPSLITSDLVNKKYKSVYMSHYVGQIFKNNLKDFPGEKTYLYFDELRTICEKDEEPAAKAIGNVAARGRINNVGLIYATQFYDKIPNSVKGAKLNYCFAFRHNNQKILGEISSDFDLSKRDREKIKNLKTFECLALTNKRFIVYMDGEKYEVTKPIKGHIIYPISNHLKPVSQK
jgi:hypothetical protein